MVNIEYDEETGVLKMNYSESVEADDMMRFIDHVSVDDRLPDDLSVLHRAGGLHRNIKMKDLLKLSKEMKRGTGKYNTVRMTVYTSNSLSLTLFQLYERLIMDANTKLKSFNSERAAVAWLLEI
jgi:hypothetical protein